MYNSAILMRDLTRPAMGIYLCEVISTLQAAGHFIKFYMTSQPKPRTVRSLFRGLRKNTRRGICTGILTCLGRGPRGFLFSLLGFFSGILLLVHASAVVGCIAAKVSPARGLLPTRPTTPAPTIRRVPGEGNGRRSAYPFGRGGTIDRATRRCFNVAAAVAAVEDIPAVCDQRFNVLAAQRVAAHWIAIFHRLE